VCHHLEATRVETAFVRPQRSQSVKPTLGPSLYRHLVDLFEPLRNNLALPL
jgi:hypothetical protein